MPKFLASRDFAAGMVLLIFAAGAWWFGRHLPMGSGARMGPGTMPMLIAGTLAVLGGVIALRAALIESPRLEAWALRPMLLVVAPLALFGIAIERVGLVIAALATVIVAGLAARDFRWHEILAAAAALTAFSVLVFRVGLGLSLRVWP
jgi:putative tricarboxylic transport membrane protein